MSANWVNDIAELHAKFGVREVVRTFDKDKLQAFLDFRVKFLQEELDELKTAKSADDVVDALIDLCVVAIGTLDVMQMNPYEAWNRVHAANMNKEVGIKASRPNPLGLPDLIKPTMDTHGRDWVAPTHVDNVGVLALLFEEARAVQPVQVEQPVQQEPDIGLNQTGPEIDEVQQVETDQAQEAPVVKKGRTKKA